MNYLRKSIGIITFGVGVALLAGCGGSSQKVTSNGVPVTLTIHSKASTKVSLLALQMDVTGATLQGSSSSTANASLISSPVTLQLANLSTQNELLANTTVPAGTYSGLMLTFSGASATIYNGSTASITVGGQSCAATATCTYTPTFNLSSTTVTSSPFPITLTKGSPVNISLNLDLNSSLQTDSTITPTVTVSTSSTALADGNLVDISSVTGQVTSVGTNTFTVTNSNTGASQTFTTASTTTYGTFTGCTANNFTCLQKNQIVTLNYGVGTDAAQTLNVTSVTPYNGFTQGIRGTVISSNPGSNTFDMVVTGESPTLSGITVGQVITVNPTTGATYGISGGGTAPSGSSFATVSDVIPGQSVFVNSTVVTTGGTYPAVAADQIQLAPIQFTGTVSALNNPNLTVNGLNTFYTGNGVSQVIVITGTNTVYSGITGNAFTGLTTGGNLMLGGYYYNSATGPVFVAGQVYNWTTTPGF